MELSEDEKERLAGRARTLQERLAAPPEQPSGQPDERPEDWLAEWREQLDAGDSATLAARLQRADVSEPTARRCLATHDWPADEPLPEWTRTLGDLLQFVGEASPGEDQFAPDDREVPFVDVLSTFVAYARSRVAGAADELGRGAMQALERWLLRRLELRAAHPLFLEFKTFVAVRDRDLAFAEDPDVPPTRRRYYDDFVRELLDGELTSLFLEYALLARLLVTTIEQWVSVVEEFRTRLSAERAELESIYGQGRQLGPVVDIEVHGDRHGNGRVVLGVTFQDGTTLAYKPRDIGPEAAFNDLLAWVNDRSELPHLRTVPCLRKDGYGWMEWVTHTPCPSPDHVQRYYRRVGVLLAVLYALRFVDGHFENVISTGEHPVVVDLETVCHPDHSVVNPDGTLLDPEKVGRSVVETGLLPAVVGDEGLDSVGGFSVADPEPSTTAPRFTDVNSDRMDLAHEPPDPPERDNLPSVDGSTVPPEDHRGAIKRGFEEAYRFLLDAKPELLADTGPLSGFENVDVRILFRATSDYGSVIHSLTAPSTLRTGLAFGCEVERLAGPLLSDDVGERRWALFERERRAMTRLDIPRFVTPATGARIHHDDWSFEDAIEEPPLRAVRDRIESLNETHLDEQLDYLDLAFGRHDPGAHADAEGVARSTAPGAASTDPQPAFERAAREVFRRISEQAHREDGDPDWYLREPHPAGGLHIRAAPAGLYSGRVGIGLFAAALAATQGDRRYRRFVDRVLAPVQDRVDSTGQLTPGAGDGLGSIVYGCAAIATLLDDDEYLGTARDAARRLTTDLVGGDGPYDVLGGAAGAVLGLVTLYEVTGETETLERAVQWGDYLLDGIVRTDQGEPAWPTGRDGQSLAGVSHGVAGIAYALDRLGDAAGVERFESTARESLAYEHRLFEPARDNWPDLRGDGRSFSVGWCHGRPGIGLARLGMLENHDHGPLRQDLDRALRGIDDGTVQAVDHVCCGNFGRVECLLEVGTTLGRERPIRRARSLAAAAVERTAERGRFTVTWQTDHWYNPTFFQGEAGIGYTLLRLDNPELPCVLSWR
jgi:type 2 lantibiotic biosynthesis protein LanM